VFGFGGILSLKLTYVHRALAFYIFVLMYVCFTGRLSSEQTVLMKITRLKTRVATAVGNSSQNK
jgi:hypothetical protein